MVESGGSLQPELPEAGQTIVGYIKPDGIPNEVCPGPQNSSWCNTTRAFQAPLVEAGGSAPGETDLSVNCARRGCPVQLGIVALRFDDSGPRPLSQDVAQQLGWPPPRPPGANDMYPTQGQQPADEQPPRHRYGMYDNRTPRPEYL